MIKRLAILLFFLMFLILPSQVFAAGEFSTNYDIVYDVDELGITTVTEKISLKNLTSEYYANQFKLTIGSTEVFDIKASDGGGLLDVSSEQKEGLTIINVKFNQQVAGLGKILPWTLTFKSKDFAEKLGKVWEVRVPKTTSEASIEDYNLTLAVPVSFGEVSTISPIPKSQSVSMGKLFLTFDKERLKSQGISANFGSIQLFDFDLSFHLENTNLVPVLTKIALPPDTAFQDVIYQRIEPKPLNVTVDADGNYLAWYKLGRRQKLDVKTYGSAKLYTNSKVKNPVLNAGLKAKYTQTSKYWEKDNPQITNKLNEIISPKDSEALKVDKIYQFVVDYLKYDAGRLKDDNIERLGGLAALKNPESAVCMEFTDLFITLARAAGIPARELDGYAYTSNPVLRPLSLTRDILHAWPEYWDDGKGWVMVDPTWQNTTGGVDYFNKLDLNHFVFTVKGLSSETPIPAGSYKYDGVESRDVKVTLSDNDFLGKPQINTEIDIQTPLIAGFPGKLKVRLENAGNAFFPSSLLGANAGQISLLNTGSQNTGIIPPFGYSEFTFDTRTKSLFDSYRDQIIITVAGQKFTKEVTVAPFILFGTIPVIIGGAAGAIVIIYLIVLGGHFYRRKLKDKKK